MGPGIELLWRWGLAPLAAIAVKRHPGGQPVEFMPQDRYVNRRNLALNPNGAGPFCQIVLPKLPSSPGVYAIVLAPDVIYVGECADFSERFGSSGYAAIHPRNCFVGGQSTNCKINNGLLRLNQLGTVPMLWFAAERHPGRKEVERSLITALSPIWNGRGASPA